MKKSLLIAGVAASLLFASAPANANPSALHWGHPWGWFWPVAAISAVGANATVLVCTGRPVATPEGFVTTLIPVYGWFKAAETCQPRRR